MIVKLESCDDVQNYKAYFQELAETDKARWEKVQPRVVDNNEAFAVKSFLSIKKKEPSIESKNETVSKMVIKKGLSYELVPAARSIDAWSLGCLLFFLLSDQSLFNVNRNDDQFVKGDEFRKLYDWNKDTKESELAMIDDLVARDLLSKLLSRNPKERIPTAEILKHQFIKCEGAADKDQKYEELIKRLKGLEEITKHIHEDVKKGNKELQDAFKYNNSKLMKAIFEATEVDTPTRFIIVPAKLESPSNTEKNASEKISQVNGYPR